MNLGSRKKNKNLTGYDADISSNNSDDKQKSRGRRSRNKKKNIGYDADNSSDKSDDIGYDKQKSRALVAAYKKRMDAAAAAAAAAAADKVPNEKIMVVNNPAANAAYFANEIARNGINVARDAYLDQIVANEGDNEYESYENSDPEKMYVYHDNDVYIYGDNRAGTKKRIRSKKRHGSKKRIKRRGSKRRY